MLLVHVCCTSWQRGALTEMTRGCLDTELIALIHSVSLAGSSGQLERQRERAEGENSDSTGGRAGRDKDRGGMDEWRRSDKVPGPSHRDREEAAPSLARALHSAELLPC